jgi:CheY-like chemotaxis protein
VAAPVSDLDILVLEDDPLVRLSLLETLAHAGYRAIGTGNGLEGLARLAEGSPRLILMDMVMPGMDGYEFLARLRANSEWSQIPVVIISSLGYALQESVDHRGRDTLGIFGIVPKPIDTATLLELVGLMLGVDGSEPQEPEPGAPPPDRE